MANRIVEMEVPGVGTVFMKLEGTSVLEDTGLNADNIRERLDSAFTDALAIIDTVSRGIFAKMSALSKDIKPKEFTIEFGVDVDTEVGAVFASSSVGASIKVGLKWISPES